MLPQAFGKLIPAGDARQSIEVITDPSLLCQVQLIRIPFRRSSPRVPPLHIQVLFAIRFTFGLISCAALQYLARRLRPTIGNGAAVLGLVVCLFNHALALSMGRLGVDSITVVLHSMAVAMWQVTS